jgi:anaerobic selenocysteine-containing dehydrogenase
MQWAFGMGAATNSIEEIYKTGCILIIGANPSSAHPVTGARIRSVVESGIPLIVIDPLKIDLARLAKYHLQINPGTNVAVLNMFAFYLLSEGLTDEDFIGKRTEGWEESGSSSCAGYDSERICGVKVVVNHCFRIWFAHAAMEFHGLRSRALASTKAITLIANIMMTGNISKVVRV